MVVVAPGEPGVTATFSAIAGATDRADRIQTSTQDAGGHIVIENPMVFVFDER